MQLPVLDYAKTSAALDALGVLGAQTPAADVLGVAADVVAAVLARVKTDVLDVEAGVVADAVEVASTRAVEGAPSSVSEVAATRVVALALVALVAALINVLPAQDHVAENAHLATVAKGVRGLRARAQVLDAEIIAQARA